MIILKTIAYWVILAILGYAMTAGKMPSNILSPLTLIMAIILAATEKQPSSS